MATKHIDAWLKLIQKLDDSELQVSMSLITEVIESYTYEEAAGHLNAWFKTLLLSNVATQHLPDTKALINFYESLHKLLYAFFLLVNGKVFKSSDFNIENALSDFWIMNETENIKISGNKEHKQNSTEERDLKKLVQLIVHLYNPQKIFIIQTYSNLQHKKVYDFFVVVTPVQIIYQRSYKKLIQLAARRIAPMQLSIITTNYLYKSLEKRHVYFSKVCIPHNLLYDKDGVSIKQTNSVSNVQGKMHFQNEFALSQAAYNGAHLFLLQNENLLSAYMLYLSLKLGLQALLKNYTGINHHQSDLMLLLEYSRRVSLQPYNWVMQINSNKSKLYTLQKVFESIHQKQSSMNVHDSTLNYLFNFTNQLLKQIKQASKQFQ